MFVRKKFTRKTISITMLFIYLFSSFSILSSHNHNEDHHHNQDLIVCENLDGNSFNNSDCSHESHIISSKESCAICDYFTNCKPGILDVSSSAFSESFILRKIKLFSSLHLIYLANNQNKSPPFII